MRVAGPFGIPVPDYPPLLRLHLPLIEPDVQISRIRLSDKTSALRPQQVLSRSPQLYQAQLLVQVFVGKARVLPNPHTILPTEPPTQPTACMLHHGVVGLDHGPQTKVVGPTSYHQIERPDFLLSHHVTRPAIRAVAQVPAQPLNLLRRRGRSDKCNLEGRFCNRGFRSLLGIHVSSGPTTR